MNRETTNKIRFILEELLPPVLHDSKIMVFLYRLKLGSIIDDLASFRKRAPFLSAEDYRQVYEQMPYIHEGSDNSQACVDLIVKNVCAGSVCDVGCGTGHILRTVRDARPDVTQLSGVDIVLRSEVDGVQDISFFEAPMEALPFKDREFDTVICTHVLEHVLDIGSALAELRRITANKLIIVVPLEREHVYTFNPHFHFFPFLHSFLRVVRPHPDRFTIENVQRDIFYVEDCSDKDESNAGQS